MVLGQNHATSSLLRHIIPGRYRMSSDDLFPFPDVQAELPVPSSLTSRQIASSRTRAVDIIGDTNHRVFDGEDIATVPVFVKVPSIFVETER